MREMVKLFIAVAVFSGLSGGVLAAIQNVTKERIEYQQIKFVKGPTIKRIMEGCTNDPLTDRVTLADKEGDIQFFVGKFNGRPDAVAFETFGKGFGGVMGVIVGVDLKADKILGVGVTTHSETPGVGSRTKTDPSFAAQFKGLPITEPFQVKADGGQIDALSGATISSRGVCGAVVKAAEIYERLKPSLMQKIRRKQG
ncbi:MAG: RnfABCDGE type electron transport complex subunit G [Deltaproteobacteria bacterium]|nr:RnfABCDGE type electron transport complex subunit G [Deltaproteobacteria bacterium]OQX65864.1 MAG: electron transporter RnfG [Desulfococcus sp. 4484_242]